MGTEIISFISLYNLIGKKLGYSRRVLRSDIKKGFALGLCGSSDGMIFLDWVFQGNV